MLFLRLCFARFAILEFFVYSFNFSFDQDGSVYSLAIESASVLVCFEQFFTLTANQFCDIVGFTPLCASVSAEIIVRLLHNLFSLFDDLTEKRGLKQLKTIGKNNLFVCFHLFFCCFFCFIFFPISFFFFFFFLLFF